MDTRSAIPLFHLALKPGWTFSSGDHQIRIKSKKARALLTILVLEQRSQNRENLAQMLWPEVDRAKARGSLRQVLSSLQRLIGGAALDVSQGSVGVNGALFSTSVDAVLADVIKPSVVDVVGVVEDFCFGLDAFDDVGADMRNWVHAAQAELRQRALRALNAPMQDAGLPPQTRHSLARSAFALDGFDEEALRALMQTNVEMGNSVQALRLYTAFFERLEAEMDAEPSPQTQNLAVDIKLASDPARPTTPYPTSHAAPTTVSVAVLPFETLGVDPVPDHMLIGLLDQITCNLATYRAPAVISSNTTRRYLNQAPSPSEVGASLQVDYVVSGALKVAGQDAVVSLQLCQTSDNMVVWANTLPCTLSALYDLKTPIAQDIVRVISPSIEAAELNRAAATSVADLEPYHAMIRAKELIFQFSPSTFGEAGMLLKDATRKSPFFAPAHALLSEWYALALWQRWSLDPVGDRNALEQHMRRAAHLSPADGRVLAMWSHNRMIFYRAYDDALDQISTALELSPNDSETLIWSVPTLAYAGAPHQAVEIGTRAAQLSPLDPFAFRNDHFLSLAHYATGDYDRAADLGLSSFQRAPSYGSNLRATIAALVAAGRRGEATTLIDHHSTIEPGFSVRDYFTWQGFRSDEERRAFCEKLIEAGLPE